MNRVKIYKLEIEFPLAFFKIPYTVKTRKTYLIPRKKAILSIFNAFFEKPISFWKIAGRNKLKNEEKILENFLVGAELLDFEKTIEKQRIVQIKSGSIERPPSETELVANAKYIFYLIPQKDIKLHKYPINYYPFAGQNDYLAFNWKLEIREGIIKESKEITLENYQLIPSEKIDISNSDAEIIIENALEKYVIVKGKAKLKEPIKILKIDNKEIILH